ncbi:unnamed protein product, partial [Brassica oleracea]
LELVSFFSHPVIKLMAESHNWNMKDGFGVSSSVLRQRAPEPLWRNSSNPIMRRPNNRTIEEYLNTRSGNDP